MTTANEIITYMESQRDDVQREVLMRFFKTGKGEYGEGDEFLGLKVPQTREVVKRVYADIPLGEVHPLLMSRWHEVRLCGLLILAKQFEQLAQKRRLHDSEAAKNRDEIVDFYLQHADQANNWDLVDLSAPTLLGGWLVLSTADTTTKMQRVDALAQSDNLWRQRISMVCTLTTSKEGDASWCLRYAEMHLRHTHDLMHKAVGWMLREMGKQVSMDLLRDFLRQHAREMPRTMLRYAIEKMSDDERRQWMER